MLIRHMPLRRDGTYNGLCLNRGALCWQMDTQCRAASRRLFVRLRNAMYWDMAEWRFDTARMIKRAAFSLL